MNHVLIVGGTGMLRGVSLGLAQRPTGVAGWGATITTSVIAQSADRLAALAADVQSKGGRVNPISLDYGRDYELAAAIDQAIAAFGPIDLAVTWIHDGAPRALTIIAERLVRPTPPPPRIFQVLGSDTADPAVAAAARQVEGRYPSIAWRRVVLGFHFRDKSSRWLTHDEICSGVLNAIDHDWTESIVGVVKPWSARPM